MSILTAPQNTINQPKMADQQDGIWLCEGLHEILHLSGYYPALTGGLLYKEGNRKDIDIVIFRHRQNVEQFEMQDIERFLVRAGLSELKYYGFVTKAKWNGFTVDLFNPETKIESLEDIYGEQE
tara:strand:+ start:1080 stop:1451 length:372 start_codon:yes stop_codon:yes gene_type:complete